MNKVFIGFFIHSVASHSRLWHYSPPLSGSIIACSLDCCIYPSQMITTLIFYIPLPPEQSLCYISHISKNMSIFLYILENRRICVHSFDICFFVREFGIKHIKQPYDLVWISPKKSRPKILNRAIKKFEMKHCQSKWHNREDIIYDVFAVAV